MNRGGQLGRACLRLLLRAYSQTDVKAQLPLRFFLVRVCHGQTPDKRHRWHTHARTDNGLADREGPEREHATVGPC